MSVHPRPRQQATAALALAAMVISSFTPLISEPSHPAWWNDRGVKNSNPIQNKGVANIGQLKNIATQAHAELESLLPGGAGYSLPFAPPPVPADAAWYQNQKKALNLGQLKAVAKPLYDRLNEISTVWVEQQLQDNGLTTLGTHYFQDASTGYFYPWNPTTPVAENYKVATVGQLKLVFCLRFGETTDGDEASDLLELAAIGSTSLVVTAAQAEQLRQDGAAPSSDSDNDGLTNAQEAALGSDTLNSDSDADGLLDGRDADPMDKAVKWKRVANASYAVIELNAPAGVEDSEGWGFVLGDGAHVVMSRELFWAGGSGAPDTDHFKTYVWNPKTTAWSALLAQPAHLRGIGTRVDKEGNVYGLGYGALGVDKHGPGFKSTLLRWGKTPNGWGTAAAQGAVGLGAGYSNESDTWTELPPLFPVPLNLFGDSGFFRSQSAHGPGSGSTSVYRHGTDDDQPFVTGYISSTQDIKINPYVQAGESRGWHAATWTKTKTDTPTPAGETPTITKDYVFARLLADESLQAGTPPVGEARWKLVSLASIEDDLKPDGVNEIVVWQMTDGKFQTGTSAGTGTTLSWQETTKVDTAQRLSGKINARGEGLQGTKIWRNGLWHNLDDMVDSSAWSNVYGVDINRSGVILARADKAGVDNGANGKLVLLLPVDLDIIKPGTEGNSTPTEIAEDKEDWDAEKKEGGWVASLNWDDDDNDGGAGGHGKLNFTNDFDDENGTQDEDDLVQLKVHCIALDNVKGRLKFDNTHFRVWKKKNRTEEVKTEDTEFDIKKDEDLILYIEGKKITEAEAAKQVELQVKVGNQEEYKKSDEVSLHVATPVILCAGWGPTVPGEETSDIVGVCTSDDEGLGTKRIDKRKNTIVLKGKNQSGKLLFYQVDLFDVIPESDPIANEVQVRLMHLDKEMKMALSLEGSHVIYSGHSNYGLGPNFNPQGTTTVEDYMNLSNFAMAGIDIEEFSILEHGGPNFHVREGDILDLVNNQLVTIPVGYQTKRFPSESNSFTKKSAGNGNPPYHFMQGNDHITIVNSTGDKPTLRYSSCFMSSCSSGRHFGMTLNKKVLFYSTNETFPTLYDPESEHNQPNVFFASVFVSYQYIRSIVEGKTWAQIDDLLTDRQKFIGAKDPNLYRFSQ